MCGFDSAVFGEEVVAIMLIGRLVLRVVERGRKKLFVVVFEGDLMQVLQGETGAEDADLLNEVELVVGVSDVGSGLAGENFWELNGSMGLASDCDRCGVLLVFGCSLV